MDAQPTTRGKTLLRQTLVVVVVVALTGFGSYSLTKKAHAIAAERQARADTAEVSRKFVSGKYLIAYVIVAAECEFCQEERTKRALAGVRDSLVINHSREFAKVSVVGVALDQDLSGGIAYLREIGNLEKTFDELSVGNSWLNESIERIVWKEGNGKPSIPQVVVFSREIDATGYPRVVGIQGDSLIADIHGRDSLIAWIGRGAPLRKVDASGIAARLSTGH